VFPTCAQKNAISATAEIVGERPSRGGSRDRVRGMPHPETASTNMRVIGSVGTVGLPLGRARTDSRAKPYKKSGRVPHRSRDPFGPSWSLRRSPRKLRGASARGAGRQGAGSLLIENAGVPASHPAISVRRPSAWSRTETLSARNAVAWPHRSVRRADLRRVAVASRIGLRPPESGARVGSGRRRRSRPAPRRLRKHPSRTGPFRYNPIGINCQGFGHTVWLACASPKGEPESSRQRRPDEG
jgi:hypothetical protein